MKILQKKKKELLTVLKSNAGKRTLMQTMKQR